MELVSAGDGGDIRTLILPAVKTLNDDTLCGIPVTSGGNYTDEAGQQWVCDEVDFGRGVYVQRVEHLVFDGSEGWKDDDKKGVRQTIILTNAIKGVASDKVSDQICSHFTTIAAYRTYGGTTGCSVKDDGTAIHFCYGSTTADANAWKNYLSEQYAAGNPVEVCAILNAPTETLLAAEELASYAEKYGSAGTVYGRTTQNGTPSPEAPMELVNHADVCQSVLASTPNGLPGIPVTSGGNYTDETGQQWVCDEVDFGRGVYVQRVGKFVADGTQGGYNASSKWWYISKDFTGFDTTNRGMCSHLKKVDSQNSLGQDGFYISQTHLLVVVYELTSAAEYRNFLSENPMIFYGVLSAPIETALSAEELAAYAILHTNYPNTTILNDGGAGMSVSYVADTKLYINNLILSKVGPNAEEVLF